MQDLTGAAQRHFIRALAFLMASVLFLPVGVSAQEASEAPLPQATASDEPTDVPTDLPTEQASEDVTPSETADPTPTMTASAVDPTAPAVAPESAALAPTQSDAAAPTLPAAGPSATPSATATAAAQPSEQASEESAEVVGALVPIPPSEPAAPTVSGQVQAEGGAAEEVVVSPAAPLPSAPASQDVAAAAAEVPAVAVEAPAEEGQASTGVAPPSITAYGPAVVPSLGTAFAPNTNTYTGGFEASAPLVLAPEVAGGEQAPPGVPLTGATTAAEAAALATSGPTAPSGIAAAIEPVRTAAVSSLSIVQPSWFATTFALLILLVAASYGALLRRRGEFVPEAVDFSSWAVRPRDAARLAVSSVRPSDLVSQQARSIRP